MYWISFIFVGIAIFMMFVVTPIVGYKHHKKNKPIIEAKRLQAIEYLKKYEKMNK